VNAVFAASCFPMVSQTAGDTSHIRFMPLVIKLKESVPSISQVTLNPAFTSRKIWQVNHGRTASMWIEEVAPERLAEFFHHYHKALEVFGKGSESGSWEETAKPEKDHSGGAVGLIHLELDSTTKASAKSRQYFAEPGEAEWGC
jgi:hypothetical protein